ncbi:MAG: hypothetical protein ABIH23_25575 [bacterium]
MSERRYVAMIPAVKVVAVFRGGGPWEAGRMSVDCFVLTRDGCVEARVMGMDGCAYNPAEEANFVKLEFGVEQ